MSPTTHRTILGCEVQMCATFKGARCAANRRSLTYAGDSATRPPSEISRQSAGAGATGRSDLTVGCSDSTVGCSANVSTLFLRAQRPMNPHFRRNKSMCVNGAALCHLSAILGAM